MSRDPTKHLAETTLGSVVDRRYVVRREIARGGMGGVFEAEHAVTRARVALKTLTRPALDIPAAHARLLREARVLGAIRHPNVVAVFDAGICDLHGPFVALEMIEGRPLDGVLLARRTLSVGQSVAVAVQLCDALESVHRTGVVHRDVKPSNVLISKTPVGDQVELIDFGVARVGPEDDVVETKITRRGEILGTVDYMSPEQIMASGPVDARTDVYAAGVLLYECLVGEVPLSGPPTVVISNFLAGTRPPPIRGRRNDVPLELEAVVRKALEIEPEKRFASARDLARACIAAVGGSVPDLELLDLRDDRVLDRVSAPTVLVPSMAPVDAPQRRRQFVRAPYVTPVRIVLDGRTVDGRTEDISEGGVLVVADAECARDQQVKLRLPLPSSGRVVTLDAVTRWVKTSRNQRALGLELIAAPDDVRAEIRAYAALMTSSGV